MRNGDANGPAGYPFRHFAVTAGRRRREAREPRGKLRGYGTAVSGGSL